MVRRLEKGAKEEVRKFVAFMRALAPGSHFFLHIMDATLLTSCLDSLSAVD